MADTPTWLDRAAAAYRSAHDWQIRQGRTADRAHAEALKAAGLVAVQAGDAQVVVTEHATRYKSGDMKVWNEDPADTAHYPVAERVALNLLSGERVWRRIVIVIKDWTEVPNQGGT